MHSLDPAEQTALQNHTGLIRTLGKRWTGKVTAFLGDLPKAMTRSRARHPGKPEAELFRCFLEDHEDQRGSRGGSLIHAAVCRAFLEERPGYAEELLDNNPPELGAA